GSAARDGSPPCASRDVWGRPRAEDGARGIQAGVVHRRGIGYGVSGTCHDDDGRQAQHHVWLMPGRKQTRCIPPQHQIELVARMLVLQLLESVCRVRKTLATDLDV